MNTSRSITFQSAMAKLGLLIIVILGLCLSVVASHSDTSLPEPLERWYKAIGNGDGEAVSGVLANGAIIQSGLTNSVMTGQEFVELLGTGKVPGVMAKMNTRLVAFHKTDAEALVCYTIAGKPVLTQESFRINHGKVTQAIQEKLADNCDSF